MKTIKQVRAEFYNALISDTDLTDLVDDRIYWLNRPTVKNTFPMITYQYFDTVGEYTLGGTGVNRSVDDITFQTNIYVDKSDIDAMHDIMECLKTVLNGIGYRNINSPITFFEVDIDKNVKPMRWEGFNV